MIDSRGSVRHLLLLCVAMTAGLCASFAAAIYVERQSDSDAQRLFQRDAASAIAEIEREIERHVEVVEDSVAFAQATWPVNLEEWREFTAGRVTGGTHLAFTSTAGVIERVPADQIDEFEARETAAAGQPFQIVELTPRPTSEDRIVLTRTGEDTTNGIQIRGLEVTPVAEFLGINLPATNDGIAVDSIDEAPDEFLELLSIRAGEFEDNDILNTNVLLSRAIGPTGQPPQGWVIIPARLGNLLSDAIDNLDRTELNIAVDIPGAGLDGELGRYEGAPGLAVADAAMERESIVEFGGWTWSVTVWADEGFGISPNRLRGDLVFLGGTILTLALSTFLHLQRRYRRRLNVAEFESNLHRTLAETDPLTGLLNRQGLIRLAETLSPAEAAGTYGCAVFFLDLDGFKAINDELGHAAGDDVLAAVGQAITGAARDVDLVGRLGGDEFVLVCPDLCDHLQAEAIADRLTTTIGHIDSPAAVGVSIGISITRPGMTFDFDRALSDADAAMYSAKRQQSRDPRIAIATTGPGRPRTS